MPASMATSSRLSPGTRRRPPTLIPASCGVTKARRACKNVPSGLSCSRARATSSSDALLGGPARPPANEGSCRVFTLLKLSITASALELFREDDYDHHLGHLAHPRHWL